MFFLQLIFAVVFTSLFSNAMDGDALGERETKQKASDESSSELTERERLVLQKVRIDIGTKSLAQVKFWIEGPGKKDLRCAQVEHESALAVMKSAFMRKGDGSGVFEYIQEKIYPRIPDNVKKQWLIAALISERYKNLQQATFLLEHCVELSEEQLGSVYHFLMDDPQKYGDELNLLFEHVLSCDLGSIKQSVALEGLSPRSKFLLKKFGPGIIEEAIVNGDVATVNFLLDNHIEIESILGTVLFDTIRKAVDDNPPAGSDYPGMVKLFVERLDLEINKEIAGIPFWIVCSPEEQAFLKQYGTNINAINEHGNTFLMEAVRKGNSNAVGILLEHGASLTVRNKKGESPLTYTLCHADKLPESLVKDIRSGAALETNHTLVEDLFSAAVVTQNRELLTALLAERATLGITDERIRAAAGQFSAVKKNKSIRYMLLSYVPKPVEAVSYEVISAWSLAAPKIQPPVQIVPQIQSQESVASEDQSGDDDQEIVIEKQKKKNMPRSKKRHADLVKKRHEREQAEHKKSEVQNKEITAPQPTQVDQQSEVTMVAPLVSPSSVSSLSSSASVVTTSIVVDNTQKQGSPRSEILGIPPLVIPKNESSRKPIDVLIECITSGSYKGVQALLQDRLLINAMLADGTTPLMCALQEGRQDIVRLLLARGAAIAARTKNGTTTYDCAGSREMRFALLKAAAMSGDLQGLDQMRTAGADFNDIYEGELPLPVIAAAHNKQFTLQWLLRNGAVANQSYERSGEFTVRHVVVQECKGGQKLLKNGDCS